jgi:hypothetical protein
LIEAETKKINGKLNRNNQEQTKANKVWKPIKGQKAINIPIETAEAMRSAETSKRINVSISRCIIRVYFHFKS